MTRLVFFLGLLFVTGCAHREPASCDGRDKRPINPGKWDQAMPLGACSPDAVRP